MKVINLTPIEIKELTKQIIELKEIMDNKRHKRKVNFVTFLYKLKHEFLDKEDDMKHKRINKLFKLKNERG